MIPEQMGGTEAWEEGKEERGWANFQVFYINLVMKKIPGPPISGYRELKMYGRFTGQIDTLGRSSANSNASRHSTQHRPEDPGKSEGIPPPESRHWEVLCTAGN